MALVDTGDFSGEPDEAGRVKTQNLLEGMETLGYQVVNLGERELAGGISRFQEMVEKSKLTFTNANFVYRDNGDQLFAPYVIRQYKLPSGRVVKIGFIGLDTFNSAFAKEAGGGRVVVMREPVEAIKLHLPGLRSRVDFVVLLANLSLRDLSSVLAAAPGVDLALASYGPRLSEGGRLETLAGVPALYSGDQGKRMGEVRVVFGAKSERPAMTSSQPFLTKRYPSEPKMQAFADRTIARVNEINRKKAEQLAAVPQAPSGAARPVASGEPVSPAAGRPYVTAMTCDNCHAKEYEIYRSSAHAHAFDTLVKANQDFNPECVKCHVTAFEQPHGFTNARQTPELANVQCEACHGNAADHLTDLQKPFGSVPPRACFTCHNKENSPDFVFYKYWDMIKH